MEPTTKTYSIRVVRESGNDPITGQFVSYDEQLFTVNANSIQNAYVSSNLFCTLHFTGQIKRIFIDGREYFNEKY